MFEIVSFMTKTILINPPMVRIMKIVIYNHLNSPMTTNDLPKIFIRQFYLPAILTFRVI